MPLKRLKPITPGQRFRIANDFSELTTSKSKPLKSLSRGKKRTGGRNNSGKITTRHIGGGHKKKYREVDFKRIKDDVPAVIKSIEYDPNRSSFISLISYADGYKSYILHVLGLKVGDVISSGENTLPNLGNTLPLSKVPLGTNVSCLELKPGAGAAMARSAGSYAQVMSKEGKYVLLKLPSKEIRLVLATCRATIGVISNSEHRQIVIAKAGRNRNLGRRPRVRGVAMNPVDHPMGGGEGKASGGHPRSESGLIAKGKKTRKTDKYSNRYIKQRRK